MVLPQMIRRFDRVMRTEVIILTIVLLLACDVPVTKSAAEKKVDFSTNHLPPSDTTNSDEPGYYDSLKTAVKDTTSLKNKREWIYNHFILNNGPSSILFDTLFDLTYDGQKDYVIGYYGGAGT